MVKDITTTLSEQSENISVMQRIVVADAHGGISSKWFSGGGSFVMLRGGVPAGRERSQLSHFRVITVLIDVVIGTPTHVITTVIIAAVIGTPTIVDATIIAATNVVAVQRMHVLDDFCTANSMFEWGVKRLGRLLGVSQAFLRRFCRFLTQFSRF